MMEELLYIVVYANSRQLVEQRVHEKIKNDKYIPQGGISVDTHQMGVTCFYQAMVKVEK